MLLPASTTSSMFGNGRRTEAEILRKIRTAIRFDCRTKVSWKSRD